MNYIMIRTDDMLNGSGLRVVLFCTACDHYCHNCHNPETWQASNGHLFDSKAKQEIFKELDKDYISGITLSGGDPLNVNNVSEIFDLILEIKDKYPNKTIWLYTGFVWEEIMSDEAELKHAKNELLNAEKWRKLMHYDVNDFTYKESIFNLRKQIISKCDVVVDGKFIEEKSDVNYPWAGSTNQRVIDVKKSLLKNEVVLWSE